ncbi:hypothetical protein VUR80DRAFT_6739 [Thermomyces stellatus]
MEQGRRNTKSQMMRSNGISHSSKRSLGRSRPDSSEPYWNPAGRALGAGAVKMHMIHHGISLAPSFQQSVKDDDESLLRESINTFKPDLSPVLSSPELMSLFLRTLVTSTHIQVTEVERLRRVEHYDMVETLAGMSPDLDEDLISDVTYQEQGRVGLAVGACLALAT